MKIINIINNFNEASKKNSSFSVSFQDEKECEAVVKKINLLTTDGNINVWDAFQGQKAKMLLANAIDGLIVFLSCKQKKNVMSGEFFSLDERHDAQLFSDYIHEAQSNAKVEIDCLAIA